MRKFAGAAFAVLLGFGLLAGCGQSYDAETGTVFVLKDGGIVSTDVEEFDAGAYDEAGLKEYIEAAVSEYNEENGEGAVTLKELTVADGNATLILEYASPADYAGFNGTELYTGTVAAALSAGYAFDGEFASVSGGNAELCQVSDFLGGEYKVVVFRGNANVQVPGTVAYVSVENTAYIDSSTIAVRAGENLLGQEQGTESASPAVDGTEAGGTETGTESETETEIDEALLSDSDDDLLAASTEETEVVFDFGDEEAKSGEVDSSAYTYTYIIYK